MSEIRDQYGVRDDSGGYYVTDEAALLAEIRYLLRQIRHLLGGTEDHRSDVENYKHFDCCGQGMVPR